MLVIFFSHQGASFYWWRYVATMLPSMFPPFLTLHSPLGPFVACIELHIVFVKHHVIDNPCYITAKTFWFRLLICICKSSLWKWLYVCMVLLYLWLKVYCYMNFVSSAIWCSLMRFRHRQKTCTVPSLMTIMMTIVEPNEKYFMSSLPWPKFALIS